MFCRFCPRFASNHGLMDWLISEWFKVDLMLPLYSLRVFYLPPRPNGAQCDVPTRPFLFSVSPSLILRCTTECVPLWFPFSRQTILPRHFWVTPPLSWWGRLPPGHSAVTPPMQFFLFVHHDLSWSPWFFYADDKMSFPTSIDIVPRIYLFFYYLLAFWAFHHPLFHFRDHFFLTPTPHPFSHQDATPENFQ